MICLKPSCALCILTRGISIPPQRLVLTIKCYYSFVAVLIIVERSILNFCVARGRKIKAFNKVVITLGTLILSAIVIITKVS